MGIAIRPGARLFSTACATEMMVVKAPVGEAELTIGGATPVTSAGDRDGSGSVAEGHDGGSAMGKRYVNADETIELLCTKPGDGAAAIDGELLVLKEAKALPASD